MDPCSFEGSRCPGWDYYQPHDCGGRNRLLMESSGRFIHLDPPDEALCGRVAERDAAAFEALYDRYRDRVYAWAAHVLGPRQAEDTTQEVFTLLWRRAGQFNQSRGQFTQWFWALTRNHILRELRGISRQKRLQMADQIAALISTAIEEGVMVQGATFLSVYTPRYPAAPTHTTP